jgi:hypothetical protein
MQNCTPTNFASSYLDWVSGMYRRPTLNPA